MPNKKQLAIFYLLSFTWGIIVSLVGLFVLLFVKIFMNKEVDIFTVAGRIAIRFKNIHFGGLSLGVVYLVDKGNSRHTHKHELGHTIQNMWMGPFFPLLVGIPSAIRYHMWSYLSKRYMDKYGETLEYDSAWFEGQATKLGYLNFAEYVDSRLSELEKL